MKPLSKALVHTQCCDPVGAQISNRGYVREIHEGWDLKEDTEIKICQYHLVAKYPEYDEMIAKWRYYININTTVRHKDMPIDYENFFEERLLTTASLRFS